MNKNWKWGEHQNIHTYVQLFKRCIDSWIICMYPHLYGYEDSDNLREFFFYYLNAQNMEYYK